MISLQDIKFNSNYNQDYIRRLERAYEKQKEEVNIWYVAYQKEKQIVDSLKLEIGRLTDLYE